jgi:hypothetical protein
MNAKPFWFIWCPGGGIIVNIIHRIFNHGSLVWVARLANYYFYTEWLPPLDDGVWVSMAWSSHRLMILEPWVFCICVHGCLLCLLFKCLGQFLSTWHDSILLFSKQSWQFDSSGIWCTPLIRVQLEMLQSVSKMTLYHPSGQVSFRNPISWVGQM